MAASLSTLFGGLEEEGGEETSELSGEGGKTRFSYKAGVE